MGQKLEWFIAAQGHAIRSVTMSHHNRHQGILVCYLINTALPKSRANQHVLALEDTTVIHVISITK
jgi:ABC-type arginine transport system permease subunit